MKRLLVLLLLTACAPPTVGPVPVTPPAQVSTALCPDCMAYAAPQFYVDWWHEIERCSGYVGKLSAIQFQVAPKPFLRLPDEPGTIAGMFFPEQNLIIFGHFWEGDGPTVMHEMLHALIWQNGARPDSGGHPVTEFGEKCVALVRKTAPAR